MKQLDVKKIYDLFDKKDNESNNGIAQEIYRIYKDSSGYIDQMAVYWDQNINFYEGAQHLVYNQSVKQYQPRPVTKYNKHIPRPVTNYIWPITNTLMSTLTRNKPSFRVVANSDKAVDINRAKLSDALLDSKYEIDDEVANLQLAVKIAIICGTVYRKDYWNTEGLQEIIYKEEPKREKKGKSKEQVEETDYNKEAQDVNEDKTEDITSVPLGDTAVSVVTPFQLIPDFQNAIKDLDDGMYVLETSVHSISDIKEKYNKKTNGYTGDAKDLTAEEDLNLRMDYFERLKGSSGNNTQQSEKPELKDHAVVIEAYIKPNKKHKKGLMIVTAGNKVLYINESPYTFGDAVNWHPYSMFRYDLHPFRHHGISMVGQIIEQQKRLNSIDSLKILNRMTMATPQWLIPQGTLLKEQVITGAPGQNIQYKPNLGVAPQKVPGVPLDSSVYQEREKQVQEMYMISGVNEVLTGNQPSGVSTATALQILLEQTNNKFAPILVALSKFLESAYGKKINLIRRKYKEPREDLINRVKALNKENREVEIDDLFTGEQLGDNLDVRIEAESMLPRSSVVEQHNLNSLAGQGIFGDLTPMGNPEGNKEFLRKFNAPNIPTPMKADMERAEWENDLLRQKKEVEVFPTDNAMIHFSTVKKEINRPEFYNSNKEDIVLDFWDHLLRHFVDIPEGAYEMLQLTPANVQKLREMAVNRNIEGAQPQPSLEERVGQLEQMASEAQQMMSATAGMPPEMGAIPEGGVAPAPDGLGGSNVPPEILNQLVGGQVIPPEMA